MEDLKEDIVELKQRYFRYKTAVAEYAAADSNGVASLKEQLAQAQAQVRDQDKTIQRQSEDITELKAKLQQQQLKTVKENDPSLVMSNDVITIRKAADKERKKADNAMLAGTDEADVQYEKAVTLYKLAVECDPEDALSWYGQGVSLRKLGNPIDAIDALRKALDIDPTGTGSTGVPGSFHHNLARVYLQISDYTAASEMSTQAVALCPEDKDFYVKFIQLRNHILSVLHDPFLCDVLSM